MWQLSCHEAFPRIPEEMVTIIGMSLHLEGSDGCIVRAAWDGDLRSGSYLGGGGTCKALHCNTYTEWHVCCKSATWLAEALDVITKLPAAFSTWSG